jgi:peptidoglycan/LPS O-acetylase OafA/YrhL
VSNRHLTIRFRPDIEGLRAVAVALVVLYHAGLPFLRGGFIGVDIFFVLSGYLITSLLVKELNSTGGINLSRFYARRVRRLLPASTLVVVVVCLIEAIVASPVAQSGVLNAALSTMLYSSNIYFALTQQHYFSLGPAANPLLHTWSLGVEEQFYFVWPIFLLLLARVFQTMGNRISVIAGLTIVSFAGCVWLTASNQAMAFFQSPPRAWEFGMGALAAFIPVEWLTSRETPCKWLGTAGLIALAASGVFIQNSADFPGWIVAIPVLATLGILQAGAGAPNSFVARMLNLRPLQYIGGISYSLYLWHWPVLMIAREILHDNSAAVRTACLVLSVLLAAVTHVAVENPIRFNSFLVSRPLLSLGIAGLLMTICLGWLAAWRLALVHSAQFRKFHDIKNDVPSLYAMGCTANSDDGRPKLCSFGEIANPRSTVVLFGDSHAAQWFAALKHISESRHWKLVTIVKAACPPMNVKALQTARAISACEHWRKQAIEAIEAMHPDIAIIASSSLYPRRDSPRLIDASEWEKGSRETFLAVARPGVAVRLIRDTPHAPYDVPSCWAQLAWNGRAACPPLVRADALSADIFEAEVRAAANIANVKVIDMSDSICGSDRCETKKGDMVLFRDSDHLTSTYVESLADELQMQLLGSMAEHPE